MVIVCVSTQTSGQKIRHLEQKDTSIIRMITLIAGNLKISVKDRFAYKRGSAANHRYVRRKVGNVAPSQWQ